MGYFDDLEIVQTLHRLYGGKYQGHPINPPYFSICLLAKGKLIVQRDGIDYPLSGPFFFWAIPGHLYQFTAERDTGRRETIWLDLGGDRARRIWEGLELLPATTGPGIPIANPAEIARKMLRIIDLSKNSQPNTHHRIVILLEELIGNVYEEAYGHLIPDRDYPLILSVVRQFQQAPEKAYDLNEIARNGGISYDSFRKKFRIFIGCSPHQYLLDCKIDKAVRMIHEQQFTIKEISDLCGFKDLSSFSRFFHQRCAVYPREYCKSMKKIEEK